MFRVVRSPRERLADFLSWRGWSQSDLAREGKLHQSTVSKALAGQRGVGLHMAHVVERLTTMEHDFGDGRVETWAAGPIRTEDWDSDDEGVTAIEDHPLAGEHDETVLGFVNAGEVSR